MPAQVHFASLFCPDYDLDLLPFWMDHYLKYNFDSYTIYLHSPFNDENKLNIASIYLHHEKIRVIRTGYDRFADGLLRHVYMDERRTQIHPESKLITVDSDEIHMLPENFKEIALRYDITRGIMTDRYDTSLHDAIEGIPLEKQFPLEGCIESEVLKNSDIKSKQGWPIQQKVKIISCTARVPIAFSGSHQLLTNNDLNNPKLLWPENSNLTIYPEEFKIFHYTWRSTILKRLAAKSYFRAQHIWYYKKFFDSFDKSQEGSAVPSALDLEMKGIIDMEETMQRQKGWM